MRGVRQLVSWTAVYLLVAANYSCSSDEDPCQKLEHDVGTNNAYLTNEMASFKADMAKAYETYKAGGYDEVTKDGFTAPLSCIGQLNMALEVLGTLRGDMVSVINGAWNETNQAVADSACKDQQVIDDIEANNDASNDTDINLAYMDYDDFSRLVTQDPYCSAGPADGDNEPNVVPNAVPAANVGVTVDGNNVLTCDATKGACSN